MPASAGGKKGSGSAQGSVRRPAPIAEPGGPCTAAGLAHLRTYVMVLLVLSQIYVAEVVLCACVFIHPIRAPSWACMTSTFVKAWAQQVWLANCVMVFCA